MLAFNPETFQRFTAAVITSKLYRLEEVPVISFIPILLI